MTQERPQSNGIPGLLRELREETSTLLQQEVALAKTELKENSARLLMRAVSMAAAGLVAYAGFIVLLIGIAQFLAVALIAGGLSRATANGIASAGVGLLVALVGWAMLAKAKAGLRSDILVPHKTIESLKTNEQWAQSKLSHS